MTNLPIVTRSGRCLAGIVGGLALLATCAGALGLRAEAASFTCVPDDALPTLGKVYDYPEVKVYSVSTHCTLQDGTLVEPYLRVDVLGRYTPAKSEAIELIRVAGQGQTEAGQPQSFTFDIRQRFSCPIDPWNTKPVQRPVGCKLLNVLSDDGVNPDAVAPFSNTTRPWSSAIVPSQFLKDAQQPAGLYPAPIPSVSVTATDVTFRTVGTPPGLDYYPVDQVVMVQRRSATGTWNQVFIGGSATQALKTSGGAQFRTFKRSLLGADGRYRMRAWYGGTKVLKNPRSAWLEFDLLPGGGSSSAAAPTTADPNLPPPPPPGPNAFPTFPSTTVATSAPATVTLAPAQTTAVTVPPIKLSTTVPAPKPGLAIVSPASGAVYTATSGVPVFITGGSGSYLFEFSQGNGRPLPNASYVYNASSFPSGMNIGTDKLAKGSVRVRARELAGTSWTDWVTFTVQ